MLTVKDSNNDPGTNVPNEKPSTFTMSNTTIFECGICTGTLYNAMSISPCGHTFCGGCICKWHSVNKHCPLCRAPCKDLVENREIRQLTKQFLEQYPEKEKELVDKIACDDFEMNYLVMYLTRWTPRTLAIIEHYVMNSRDSNFESCVQNENFRYNQRMERLQVLRTNQHKRNNVKEPLIAATDYIESLKTDNDQEKRLFNDMRFALHRENTQMFDDSRDGTFDDDEDDIDLDDFQSLNFITRRMNDPMDALMGRGPLLVALRSYDDEEIRSIDIIRHFHRAPTPPRQQPDNLPARRRRRRTQSAAMIVRRPTASSRQNRRPRVEPVRRSARLATRRNNLQQQQQQQGARRND